MLCSLIPNGEEINAYGDRYMTYKVGRYTDWNGGSAFVVGDGSMKTARQLLRHEQRMAFQNDIKLTSLMERIGALIVMLIILAILW